MKKHTKLKVLNYKLIGNKSVTNCPKNITKNVTGSVLSFLMNKTDSKTTEKCSHSYQSQLLQVLKTHKKSHAVYCFPWGHVSNKHSFYNCTTSILWGNFIFIGLLKVFLASIHKVISVFIRKFFHTSSIHRINLFLVVKGP